MKPSTITLKETPKSCGECMFMEYRRSDWVLEREDEWQTNMNYGN